MIQPLDISPEPSAEFANTTVPTTSMFAHLCVYQSVCSESQCIQGSLFSCVPNMRAERRLTSRQCPPHTYLPVPAQPCWWWGRRGSCAAGPLLDKEAFRWEGLVWGHTLFLMTTLPPNPSNNTHQTYLMAVRVSFHSQSDEVNYKV